MAQVKRCWFDALLLRMYNQDEAQAENGERFGSRFLRDEESVRWEPEHRETGRKDETLCSASRIFEI